jgi:hypothetical protein
MSNELIAASSLLALTVIVHSVGMITLFRWVVRSRALAASNFWPVTWLVIRIAYSLVAIHLIEIAVWAIYYWRQECLPDIESSFYFSGVTYTTVGYGDLVLSNHWRLLGPVEGLTGILMCGLSTGFFFAIVSRIYSLQQKGS